MKILILLLFFTEVIGLKKGFRSPFAFLGYWLYSPKNKQEAIIHIFSKEAKFNEFSLKTNNSNDLLLECNLQMQY